MASRPLAAKSTGSCPKACTASEWNGTPYARATAASSVIGCTVPTSLFAHITVTSATDCGVRGDRGLAGRPGATRPAASTGSHSTTAPSCSASHRAASSTAWCSTALARMRSRAGSSLRRCPVQALDGQVVRLGAAAGEDDLARPRAEGGGERLAGLLDEPPGGPAGGVQRRRVADAAEARGHRLDRLGDHRRGRRVVEVDRAGLGTAVDGWGHRRRSLRRAADVDRLSPCAP